MPNSEFEKLLRRSVETERPAAPSEAGWAAISDRLGPAAATDRPVSYRWAVLLVLLLSLLGSLYICYHTYQKLQLKREEVALLEEDRNRRTANLNAENERLRKDLEASNAELVRTQIELKDASDLMRTIEEQNDRSGAVIDRLQQRLSISERELRHLENQLRAAAGGTSVEVPTLTPPNSIESDGSEQPEFTRPLTAQILSGKTIPVHSLSDSRPDHTFTYRELPKEKIPLTDRLRHTGTVLNIGGSVGFPEIITSSETLSALALSAGGRFEYGIGNHFQILAGVDFWKISYGGLNVRYFPEFLAVSLDDHVNVLQTPRHFLSTQRMQRLTLGLKYLPGTRGAWQPYLAVNTVLERARTERLLYVAYDELLGKNVLFDVSENYLNRHRADHPEWVSVELRPGLSYHFAERFGANAELYYALPLDVGKREARFSPRAGLRLGISYRVF